MDESRLRRHRRTFRTRRPVLFCAACGSTNLDQNSIHELRCYDCGTSAPWDATKFSVRRCDGSPSGGDELDVVTGFQTRDRYLTEPASDPN